MCNHEGRPCPGTEICVYCDAIITQSPKDGAWEDESGACGCGDGEHEPAADSPSDAHWRAVDA